MKTFVDKNGLNLIVKHNKTNVILETDNHNLIRDYILRLNFDDNTLKELKIYLEIISKQIWCDFTPKEADSYSSDYAEYYDRKYDSNPYLSLNKDGELLIEKPHEDSPYMYKFNKRRMESFIYDLLKFLHI